MKELLLYIARSLVDHPDQVTVNGGGKRRRADAGLRVP